MIPHPSLDMNLLKEHQFYSNNGEEGGATGGGKAVIGGGATATAAGANDLMANKELVKNSVQNACHHLVAFDKENIFSFDNLLRVLVIASIVSITLGLARAFLSRRRRQHLKEKLKPINYV